MKSARVAIRDTLDDAIRSGQSHLCQMNATDQSGRVWSAEKDLVDLAAGGYVSGKR